jgi:hypothetical protein
MKKEVDYDTDEEENELLSKEPKQSLLSKIVKLGFNRRRKTKHNK